ncbi:MAG: TauD/TfdA dioxygenase family protein, partial [Burkholderiales bacterium]
NHTVLYAIYVPREGGKTGFNNMYAAYETLPADLCERVKHLTLKHDATTDAAGYVRKRFADSAGADLRTTPGAVHPLVRTHPETGRACLYLGRRSKAYLTGLPLEESEALLDALWAHATAPKLAWFHDWRAGDLLMWDNRCVMHRREPFDPNARRILHRVVIKGTKPYFQKEL